MYLTAITIQAKGNKLKQEFYEIFLQKGLFTNDIEIEGSHYNTYKKRPFFLIHSYILTLLQKYAQEVGIKNMDISNNEIYKLTNIEIYYENLILNEFENIIMSVREIFYNCGIYIDLPIIRKIINLYYPQSKI